MRLHPVRDFEAQTTPFNNPPETGLFFTGLEIYVKRFGFSSDGKKVDIFIAASSWRVLIWIVRG